MTTTSLGEDGWEEKCWYPGVDPGDLGRALLPESGSQLFYHHPDHAGVFGTQVYETEGRMRELVGPRESRAGRFAGPSLAILHLQLLL